MSAGLLTTQMIWKLALRCCLRAVLLALVLVMPAAIYREHLVFLFFSLSSIWFLLRLLRTVPAVIVRVLCDDLMPSVSWRMQFTHLCCVWRCHLQAVLVVLVLRMLDAIYRQPFFSLFFNIIPAASVTCHCAPYPVLVWWPYALCGLKNAIYAHLCCVWRCHLQAVLVVSGLRMMAAICIEL